MLSHGCPEPHVTEAGNMVQATQRLWHLGQTFFTRARALGSIGLRPLLYRQSGSMPGFQHASNVLPTGVCETCLLDNSANPANPTSWQGRPLDPPAVHEAIELLKATGVVGNSEMSKDSRVLRLGRRPLPGSPLDPSGQACPDQLWGRVFSRPSGRAGRLGRLSGISLGHEVDQRLQHYPVLASAEVPMLFVVVCTCFVAERQAPFGRSGQSFTPRSLFKVQHEELKHGKNALGCSSFDVYFSAHPRILRVMYIEPVWLPYTVMQMLQKLHTKSSRCARVPV